MSWPTKKLGEVLELCDSGTWGSESPDGMPILRSTNMQNGELVSDDLRYIDVPKDKTSQYTLREGDILITKSSGSVDHIGKSLFITKEMDGKYGFSNFTQRLRTNQRLVLPKWVYLKISNPATRDFLLGASQTTTGLRNLKIPVLKELEIPLPPLIEQKKIIAKLEKLLGKIKEAKQLRAEAQEAAKNLLPAELHKIFEEGKKKGWEEKALGEICEHPQYGFTASSTLESVGSKFLRITDIQDGRVEWGTVPYCKCSDVEKYRLKKGDIVFARTGATVGKSYLITSVPGDAIYASYLIRLRAKNIATSEFLYYFFQSDDYWRQISHEQVGMAQPNVNGSKLVKIKILLPLLAEQKRIVAHLDSLSEKIKKLQEYQRSTAFDLATLEQSILHKAFRGELVK